MTTPAESGVVVEPRVGAAAVRKTHLLAAILYRSFYQDRLGTNTGKALKKTEGMRFSEKQACDAMYGRYGELAEVALTDRDACRGISGS